MQSQLVNFKKLPRLHVYSDLSYNRKPRFHHMYRKVASSSTSRLVARLNQQHPQKGQRFKQQHVLVSSNKYVLIIFFQSNRSNLILKSSTFLPNVGSSRVPSDFSQSLLLKMHLQENKNAQSKNFASFCDMEHVKIEHKPW